MGTFYDNLPYTARVIRLAQNENPYGSAPKALEAIKKNIHLLNQYPIYNPEHLIERIGRHLGVDHARIAVSAGSVEMIDLAIKAFVGFDEEV
ncbi:MAG: aminotransferase class I/II-fold pyridoxal phosphate-dependent enzyme, partial [Flavobacteriales bacterium]